MKTRLIPPLFAASIFFVAGARPAPDQGFADPGQRAFYRPRIRHSCRASVSSDSGRTQTATHTRQDESPWDRLEHRIKSAGVAPQQVQVLWMKHAIAMKNDGRVRQFGEFPKHAQQLKDDMAEILRMLKQRYPNLKLAYVSSRSYGGYASTTLNPEPYAYESAIAVRWLIQDQSKGLPSLSYTAGKAPLLLWGPYLWADGERGRKSDDLVYHREDYRDDGTHPSDCGQQKIASQLLKFFKTDPAARPWFLEH
jgi:hypothetical protein